jgi:hypothetical protein
MAQTGYTPILIYSSSTTTNAPAVGNLTNSTLGSELAINITDGKLFYKDNANAIQVIAWKTTPTTAGGTGLTSYTAGDLLYYATGTTLSKLAIGASGRWLGSSGSAPQWNAPAALTKTDDTNVTLTLGGSASTALLNAASLTLGWTGTLGVSRGGTGTGTAFTAGSVLFAGASGVYSQDNANFYWDDTNNRLAVGTTAPQFDFTVSKQGTGVTSYIGIRAGEGGSASTSNVAVLYYRIRGGGPGDVDGSIQYSYTGATDGYALTYNASGNHLFNNNIVITGSTQTDGLVSHAGTGGAFGSNKFNFQWTGNPILWVDGTNVGQIATVSDYRIKRNITPQTESGISKIMQLRPVVYQLANYNNLFVADDEIKEGFIAHELQEVIPSAVSGQKDAEDQIQSLRLDAILSVAVKAIQEQQQQIETLKAEVAVLKGM